MSNERVAYLEMIALVNLLGQIIIEKGLPSKLQKIDLNQPNQFPDLQCIGVVFKLISNQNQL